MSALLGLGIGGAALASTMNDGEPQLARSAFEEAGPHAEILAASVLPSLQPTPLPNDPFSVSTHRLSNGLTVFIASDQQAPRLMTAVAVRAGSVHEQPGATGVAHLLEHMMFKGTSRIGTVAYDREEPLFRQRDALAAELASTVDPQRRAALLTEIQTVVEQASAFAIPNERGFDSDPLLTKWSRLSEVDHAAFERFLQAFTAGPPIITSHGNARRLDLEGLAELGRVQAVRPEELVRP